MRTLLLRRRSGFALVVLTTLSITACNSAASTDPGLATPTPDATHTIPAPELDSVPIVGRLTGSLSGPARSYEQYPAVAGNDLWLTDADRGSLLRIRLDTGELVAEIPAGVAGVFPPDLHAVAVRGDEVWSGYNHYGGFFIVDANTDAIVRSVESSIRPYAMAFGEDGLWVTDFDHSKVAKIDPDTGAEVAVIDVPFPTGIAVTSDAVWVAGHSDGTLIRIDPAKATITDTITFKGKSTQVVAAFGAIWVGIYGRNPGGVARVDPVTFAVTYIDTGKGTGGVAADDTHVWLASETLGCGPPDGFLFRIDPVSNRVDGWLEGPGCPTWIHVEGDQLWTMAEDGSVARAVIDG
jgi:hypothetical protein